MNLLAPEFLTLFSLFALAAIAPGADFACVMRESIAFGRRAGVLAALGVGSAIMIHVTYTVTGVGLLIAHSLLAFTIIKWCGALYLIYLGLRALTAKRAAPAEGNLHVADLARTPRQAFGAGFLTNLLNPKATLFFVSLFATIISRETPVAVQFGYGLVLSLFLAAWFSVVALFLTTRSMRSMFERVGHWVERITGLVFIGLGIRVALQKAA